MKKWLVVVFAVALGIGLFRLPVLRAVTASYNETVRIVDSAGNILGGVASGVTANYNSTVRVVDANGNVLNTLGLPYVSPTSLGAKADATQLFDAAMLAGPGAQWDLSSGSTAAFFSAVAYGYTGVNTSSPIDVVGCSDNTTGTPTAPSITTATTNEQVIYVSATNASSTTSIPTGFGNKEQFIYNGTVYGIVAGDKNFAAAGATGSQAGGQTGGGTNWISCLIALTPATSIVNSGASVQHTVTPYKDLGITDPSTATSAVEVACWSFYKGGGGNPAMPAGWTSIAMGDTSPDGNIEIKCAWHLTPSVPGTALSTNQPLTTIAESGTTVTAQTGAGGNLPTDWQVGQNVTIAGVGVGGYNGTFAITGLNYTTGAFTYTAGSGLGSSSGGTATVNTPFSAADVNKIICVDNAGFGVFYGGATRNVDLCGTITAFVDSADVTLSFANITGANVQAKQFRWGTDNGSPTNFLQRAIDSVGTNGGTVVFGPTYATSKGLQMPRKAPIVLMGTGAITTVQGATNFVGAFGNDLTASGGGIWWLTKSMTTPGINFGPTWANQATDTAEQSYLFQSAVENMSLLAGVGYHADAGGAATPSNPCGAGDGIDVINWTEVLMTNNVIHGWDGHGICSWAHNGAFNEFISLIQNHIYVNGAAGGDGVVFEGSGITAQNYLATNIIEDNGVDGVAVGGGGGSFETAVMVLQNTIQHNNQLQSGTHYNLNYGSASNSIVEGNWFEGGLGGTASNCLNGGAGTSGVSGGQTVGQLWIGNHYGSGNGCDNINNPTLQISLKTGTSIAGGGSLATGSNAFSGVVTSSAATGNVVTPGFTCPNAVVAALQDDTTAGGAKVTAQNATTFTFSATASDTVEYQAGCR